MENIDKVIEFDSKPYFVETLFAPEQPEFFFQEQEVTIPTQVLKINEQEMLKFPAEEEKKKKLLGEYENIIRMYGLNNKINIYADYLAMLSEAEKSKKLEKNPILGIFYYSQGLTCTIQCLQFLIFSSIES